MKGIILAGGTGSRLYPETPFTEGIEKTIRWYLDNQAWVEEVASGDY